MLLVLLLACRPPPSPMGPLAADAALAAARATRADAMVPVSARFSLHLETPESTVNAPGALLVRPPDDFRIEISGPIGPPQIVVACDGKRLVAWHAPKSTLYVADDAATALAGLTGGAAGFEVLTALLLGQYAEPSAQGLSAMGPDEWPPRDAPEAGPPSQWRWTWCEPGGACVTEGLSQASGRLVAVEASTPMRPLLSASLRPGALWPERLDVHLVPLNVRAELAFTAWTPASPTDAAFTLTTPPGATVTPLVLGTTAPSPGASPTP